MLFRSFIVNKFKEHGFLVKAPISGHAPSFSKIGFKILGEFLNHPNKAPNTSEFSSNKKVKFVSDVILSSGVSNFANSLGELDILFFLPLLLAFSILFILILRFIYLFLKAKNNNNPDKEIKILIGSASILGLLVIVLLVFAIKDTANDNFYILAFGLQEKFSYLFILQWIFVGLTAFSVLYFIIKLRHILSKGTVAVALFALILICAYLQYWGFLL